MPKNAFMTGASSGFGKVVLKHLLSSDWRVYVLIRDPGKLEDLNRTEEGLQLVQGDLNDLGSVKEGINNLGSEIQFDLLINNAGVLAFKRENTVDGYESTYQVNLLGLALVTELVKPRLNKGSKIINTSSGLHQGKINFNDLQMKKGWGAIKAYRQSKLGVIQLTRLWAKNNDGFHYYTDHPGLIKTELARSANWLVKTVFGMIGKTPEQGAETLIHLVETPPDELVDGEFYMHSQVKRITAESYNMESAQRLWEAVQEQLNSLA